MYIEIAVFKLKKNCIPKKNIIISTVANIQAVDSWILIKQQVISGEKWQTLSQCEYIQNSY